MWPQTLKYQKEIEVSATRKPTDELLKIYDRRPIPNRAALDRVLDAIIVRRVSLTRF